VASTVLHAVPQLPQFSLSTAVSEQTPLQHRGDVPRHLFPQVLQLKRSVFGSTQRSPQQILPVAHVVPPPQVSAQAPDSVHFFVAGQSPCTTQSTHRWMSGLQCWPGHDSSPLQPGTQVSVLGWQY
jgi:hypothetical protein